MLGRVAVAPEGEEEFGGLWPGPFGGNMDASDVREGTTVYLPVFHPGALFYFGDGHALQGDGEVCGSGPGDVDGGRVPLRPAEEDGRSPGRAWRTPSTSWSRAARGRSPTRCASRSWSSSSGWSRTTGSTRRTRTSSSRRSRWCAWRNMVDPLYTVVAKFPKRYLPERDGRPADGPARRLADMPWTEAETVLTPDRVVVLPLGAAAKEHGPHLLAAQRPDPGRLLRARACWRRGRSRCCRR